MVEMVEIVELLVLADVRMDVETAAAVEGLVVVAG